MTYKTLTPAEVSQAADATRVPNFIIASVFKSGYVGDPLGLAEDLAYWFEATGSKSWVDALAGWHAKTPSGVLDKHAVSYAEQLLRQGENLPRRLIGAAPTSLLTIPALIIASGGAAAAGEAAAGAATAGEVGAATAGEGAAAGSAAGGAAGTAFKVATGVKSAVAALSITALLADPGLWKGAAMVIAGAVLLLLAIRSAGAI